MKRRAGKTAVIKVRTGKYSLDAVRYAAHAVSGGAYVFIRPAAGGVAVELIPKSSLSAKTLSTRFRSELKDEKLRAAISDANRDLREFMILKALSYEEPPAVVPEDSCLTPEQERELDALIAQVEKEIREESAGKSGGDPLGITRTWEEKYGAATNRKK